MKTNTSDAPSAMDWTEFKLMCNIKKTLCNVESLNEIEDTDMVIYNSMLHNMCASLRRDEAYFVKKRGGSKKQRVVEESL